MPSTKSRPVRGAATARPTPTAPELGLPSCTVSLWARVAQLHAMVNRGERVIAEELADRFGVDVRTMYRTFDFMKDDLGAPLEWSHELKNNVYTRPYPFLPLVSLTLDEDFALGLMKQAFGALMGGPLGPLLESALRKFGSVAAGSVSFSSAALGDLTAPAAVLNETEQRHLATVYLAMRQQRELRIDYQKRRAKTVEKRTVHPLHLAWLDERWVLIAHDPGRGELRRFIVGRMHGAELTDASFTRPADFDAAKVLSGNLGAFTGTRDYEVRIRLRDGAAVRAREKPWHRSQQIIELGGGRIEIALRLNNLVEVKGAVLRWGPSAEVVSPPALRAHVAKAHRAALAQYN